MPYSELPPTSPAIVGEIAKIFFGRDGQAKLEKWGKLGIVFWMGCLYHKRRERTPARPDRVSGETLLLKGGRRFRPQPFMNRAQQTNRPHNLDVPMFIRKC